MMPCSKFSGGRGSNEIMFKQWKNDLEMWFSMYGISAANQLDCFRGGNKVGGGHFATGLKEHCSKSV